MVLYPWGLQCHFVHPVLLQTASSVLHTASVLHTTTIAITPHLYSNYTVLWESCIFCSAMNKYLLKLPIEKLWLHPITVFEEKHKLNKTGNRHLVIRKKKTLQLNSEENISKQAKISSDKVWQVIILHFSLSLTALSYPALRL